MPRVSQAYRERQAASILAAATRCFARGGFSTTSMDEIITETGMSSSTVYRYFPDGKQSLIRAVSRSRIGPLLERIATTAAKEHPPPPEQTLVEYMDSPRLYVEGPTDDARQAFASSSHLAVNAWAELPRDPEMRDMIRENYFAIHAALTQLVRRWQDNGDVDTVLAPEAAAAIIQNAMFGLVAEQAITGQADIPAAASRLNRLLCPARESASETPTRKP